MRPKVATSDRWELSFTMEASTLHSASDELHGLREELTTVETLIEAIGIPQDVADQQFVANLLTESDVIKAAIQESNPHEQPIPEPPNSTPEQRLRYGFNLKEPPVRPPFNDPHFTDWPANLISPEGPPPFDKLEPHPSVAPPPGYCYPQAQTYLVKKDNRYRRGYVAIADFQSSTKRDLKARQLRMAIPPGATNPPFKDGRFHPLPLPGCVHAVPGLTMAHTINGDADNIVTFWGCQTLKSMEKLLPPELYSEFHRRAVNVACNSWGCPETTSRRARPPFYTYQGLKRNDRSAKNLPAGSFDGSYNLASTVGKGEGQGCVFPAAQIDSPEGTAQIKEILEDLAFLGDAALQVTLSRFEYEVTQFHAKDNNIFGFGGLKPYATGCQVNVSSSTMKLSQSIGEAQGSLHPDVSDDWTRITVGLMFVRGPPGAHMLHCFLEHTHSNYLSGSDPGPFIGGRYGVYSRELDGWLVIIIFIGNDLHSGFTPTFDVATKLEWIDMESLDEPWNRAGPQNRLFFVNYYGIAPAHRLASMSITPPLHFGNQGATRPHKVQQRNYCEHGAMILGSADARANRIGRELVFQLMNGLIAADLTLTVPITQLMKAITYTNEAGKKVSLRPPDYDMVADATYVQQWRGYYAWYRQQRLTYYIRLTKEEFGSVQAYLKCKSADTESFPITERRPFVVRSLKRYLGQPEHVVLSVLGRRWIDGKVCQ